MIARLPKEIKISQETIKMKLCFKTILPIILISAMLILLVGCFPLKNQSPIITSTPITLAEVDELYTYQVEATDPDGDTLTYSLDVKPSGMTINSATGLIKWTPTAKGDYDVVVKVSDGALDITQSFTIVVSKAEEPVYTPPEEEETVYTPPVIPPGVPVIPVMGGTVTITGDAKYGEELTADITGITYNPATGADVPTYQWKRGGAEIGGAINATYTLVKADIGAVITVTVTADGTNATGSVTSAPTAAVGKAAGPAAPTGIGKTDETVAGAKDGTLTGTAAGQEYQVDGAGAWTAITGVTVTGLAPGSYMVRVAETDTHLAGDAAGPFVIAAGVIRALNIVAGSGEVTITSNYGDVVTGTDVPTIYYGGDVNSWKDLGDNLQARVTTAFPNKMVTLVLTPNAASNEVTITGTKEFHGNIPSRTLEVVVCDKIDTTITNKSFTVVVSGINNAYVLTIGTIIVLP